MPNKNTRICSAHFINNEKSEHPLHPSYVPSIFPGNERVERSIQALRRFERIQRRRSQNALNNNRLRVPDIYKSNNNSNNNSSDIVMEQDNNGLLPDMVEQHHIDINISNINSKPVQRNIACQTDEIMVNTLNDTTYFFCNLNCHDGLCTAAVQANIPLKVTADKMCEANIPILKKNVKDSGCDPINEDLRKTLCQGFHGLSSIANNECLSSLTGVTFPIFSFLLNLLPDSKTTKLNKQTNLLITLMKLKTGLTFTALAVLFNIHRTTAHRAFVKHLNQLNILLKKFVYWPSKATVRLTLPKAFKQHYPETRVIIDCTEVNTEVPPEVKQRVLMYSEYKHHHTVKFMVGCTPNGFIRFVSKCYGGRAGNCFITNDCGIVDLIEPGDVVLADKGFPQIRTEVEKKNAVFIMPPFCHNEQFTPKEVDETYTIASVRIHIERVNQRIKDFNILSKVPVSLFSHVDKVVFVICALINIGKPLFKNEKDE